MGKTSKPVKFLLIGMTETPVELLPLIEQGHQVRHDSEPFSEYTIYEPDIVLGEKCWRWLPGVSGRWINLILKEARAAQPPRPKKVKAKRGTPAS